MLRIIVGKYSHTGLSVGVIIGNEKGITSWIIVSLELDILTLAFKS